MGQKNQYGLIISLIVLASLASSCGSSTGNGSTGKTAPDPNIENQIDPKTYSGVKDIWKVTASSCGQNLITLDSTERYGIDLGQDYYWEIAATQEGTESCKTAHLYSIVVTSRKTESADVAATSASSMPMFSETGVLKANTYRKRCKDTVTGNITDTGAVPDTSVEQRTIHVQAMKSMLVLQFGKSPLCPGDKLVVSLVRE